MRKGRAGRRKLTVAQAAVARVLGPLDGARIPGGCEDFTAYMTFTSISPGVWGNSVFHDDDCPVLATH